MNTKPTPQLIDARPEIFAWIDSIRANEEISPADLQKTLPNGFALTGDVDEPLLHGPLGTAMRIKTMEQWGGTLKIKGLVLLEAIARLLECGPPVWNRSAEAQAAYWRKEIKTADVMMVEPKDEFLTRSSMEDHIERCHTCQPTNKLLAEAVSYGSTRYGDTHLRELITLSHADPAAAVAHYTQVRDSHRAPFLPAEKPQRAKREQVPA